MIHLDHLTVDCPGYPFRIDGCAHQDEWLTPRPEQAEQEIRFHRTLMKLVEYHQSLG